MKHNHQYYGQVQCQIYVTQLDYADFVVRTQARSDNIHIERILKDDIYFDTMVRKCSICFREIIVPELYNGVIKSFF